MLSLLLTNDDGVDAPGLAALMRRATPFGRVRVIAPASPQSGCGHTFTTHRTLDYSRRDDGRIAVDGTPADCVRLGLNHLASEAECVLSGINQGGNLGADVYRSGTVAAVREAVLHGRSGIAISQYLTRGREVDWEVSERLVDRVLKQLLTQTWVHGSFWNVNLPHPLPGDREPGLIFCPLDPSPFPLSYRVEGDSATYTGVYQERTHRPGSDISVCFGGDISITRVSLQC